MKLNIYLFAGLVLASGILASCSSSDEPGGTPNVEPIPTRVVGQAMDDVTSSMQSTIINTASPTYVNNKAGFTRAADSGFNIAALGIPTDELEKVPAAPTTLPKKKYDTSKSGEEQGECYLDNGVLDHINMNGLTLYITGNVTHKNGDWGDGNTVIYVMPGATLTEESSRFFENGGTIYNYGTLKLTRGSFGIWSNEKVYSRGTIEMPNTNVEVQGSFIIDGSLNAGGLNLSATTTRFSSSKGVKLSNAFKTNAATAYIGGDLVAKKFDFSSTAKTNIIGNLDMSSEDITMQGYLHVGGTVKANSLKMDAAGDLICDCSLIINGMLNTNATNNIYAQYIKADDMYQCSTAKVYLKNNSILEVNGTYENQNNGNDAGIVLLNEEGKQSQAVVIFDKVKMNAGFGGYWTSDGPSLRNVFFLKTPADATGRTGRIGVKCDSWTYAGLSRVYKGNEVDFVGATAEPISDPTMSHFSIPADECHGGKGFNPGKDPTPIPQVISSQHTHDISATGVQTDGNNVYVSFHQRGEKLSGCLESFSVSNDSVVLKQFIRDHNNSIDFNHLCLDKANNRVYVVGNNKNGGFLGYIKLKGGYFDCEAENKAGLDSIELIDSIYEPLKIVKLRQASDNANGRVGNGGDGNAVIVNGDVIQVASTYGFEFFNKDLQGLGTKATPGKAKHIAYTNMGNGNEVIVSYFKNQVAKGDTLTPVPLRIQKYDKSDQYLENPKADFDAHDVTPNNGKNTIAEYDGKIYSCQGARGLYVYDANTGSETGHYVETFNESTAKGKSATETVSANGVAVDAKYVYVAYGTAGLIVLDRNTLKEVTRFVKVRSANYVALAGGYIYVAYGRSNLQVYKLPDNL